MYCDHHMQDKRPGLILLAKGFECCWQGFPTWPLLIPLAQEFHLHSSTLDPPGWWRSPSSATSTWQSFSPAQPSFLAFYVYVGFQKPPTRDKYVKYWNIEEMLKSNIEKESTAASRRGQCNFGKYFQKLPIFCQILKSTIEKESPTASRGGQGHFGKYWCRIHVPLSCYLSPLVIIIISYTVKFLISRKIYERRILNQTILLVTCVASKIEYILWITIW